MWDLNSPTRDQTCTPAVETQSLNHLTTRETPGTGSFDHTTVGNVTPETFKGWRDF